MSRLALSQLIHIVMNYHQPPVSFNHLMRLKPQYIRHVK
jgi:hypothetical protein